MTQLPLIIATSFIAGCGILAAAFGIGWGGWLELPQDDQIVVVRSLAASLGLVLLLMIALAILASGSQRWIAASLAALLLLGFSAFTIVSFGILVAPLALMLLGVSIWKLCSST